MLKSNVGYSVLPDPFDSGVESVTKALKGLTNPKLCLLFGSSNYDSVNLLNGAKSILQNIPLVGCTSMGVMIPDGIIDNQDGYSACMIIDDPDMIVGVSCLPKEKDARLLGRKLVIEALNNAKMKTRPNYFCLFSSPGNEEEYLKGIQDVIGRIPCFGGTSTDNDFKCEYKLYCNRSVQSEGCSLVLFYTTKKINLEFTGAYNQTGKIGLITMTDGNRIIMKINNKQALDVYNEWNLSSNQDLSTDKIFDFSNLKPFGIRDISGDIILVKQPIFVNGDDTIEIGSNVVTSTAIVGLTANLNDILLGTKIALNMCHTKINKKPGCFILCNSIGRIKALGDKKNDLFNYIKSEVGNVPFIMPYTLAEFGYSNHTANLCGNLMMSFVCFSEE